MSGRLSDPAHCIDSALELLDRGKVRDAHQMVLRAQELLESQEGDQ